MDRAPAAGFPLTASQRRLWALSQQGLAPRIACLVDLVGEHDLRLLRAAVEQVARRHEMLRTGFLRRPGMRFPLQVPRDEAPAVWLEADLAGPAGAGGGDPLEDLWRRELAAPVEDGAGPLRATLVNRADGGRSLLLSAPSLCADAASLRRIVEELALAYAGEGDPEEPAPYLDVAEWQSELPATGDEEAARAGAFWSRQDAASLRAPVLPFETAAVPGVAGVAGVAGGPARLGVDLAGAPGDGLAAAAARHGVSRAEVLRLAWQALLARLAGEPTFLVHELLDGRTDEQLRSVVGPLSRWIPWRVALEDDPAPEEALRRSGRLLADLEAWQHHLGWPQEPDLAADEAVVGFLAETWPAFPAGAGRSLAVRRAPAWSEPFKAVLWCGELGEDFAVELRYDPRRLGRQDMELLASQLAALLADWTADVPGVGALRLAGAAEERELARRGQGEALAVPGPTVHRLIEAQAARRPEAPAVVCGERVLSYGELNARANRLARVLRRRGVTPDTPVALYVERSPELMVGMLAILKAGGAYAPLDTAQPARRLAMVLDDLGAPVVVTENALASRLPAFPGAVVRIDGVSGFDGVDGDRDEIDREAAEDLDGGALPESLAYVIFTSGSTGRPKGVAVEHRQLLNYLAGVRVRLGLEDGWSYASVSTFAADLGNTAVFPALAGGGCLHLVSQERAADPAGMVEYLARHAVDCLKIVPTHLEALHAAADPARLLPRRRLVLGGEASRPGRTAELARLAGECRVFNHYGPSETTVGVLTFPVPEQADGRWRTLPVGRPIPNVAVHLLDREGRRVALWEPGEVHIGGASVARGYFGRPDLTAQSFVPDPFAAEPGARLYRTGDLARLLPEGGVEFLGRRDHQVKFHGFRVELEEIRALLNTHPQVRDSVVRATRDASGRDALIAYYLSRQELEFGDLRSWLAQGLAEEVLPNFFVHLRKLPLTLNGKINYQALPGIEEVKQQARRAFVAPRTATEETVAGIWSEVLAVSPVSAEANFFELGGHSLLATRIISRLRESCGVELALRAIFDTPTVAGLARTVDTRKVEALAKEPQLEGLPAGAGAERSIEDELADLEGLTDEQALRL